MTTYITGSEKAVSYPPQSAYYIGSENLRSDVLEYSMDAIRTISVGTGADSAGGDAFGRARISEPFTIGDYKHLYAIDTAFIDSTSSGGTITFLPNQAAVTLATSSASTSSYTIHQTKQYHQYQPGKSQLVLSSFNFGYAEKNATKRTGYFDDRDGIYFEQVGSNTSNGTDNGTLNWVLRTYTSGSAVETGTRIPQSQWNIDPCDGTGKSGFNINISKIQLIFIDFQWLGVGRVRCGFVHDGVMIIAHEFYNSNNGTVAFMSNPNLPVRCEIRNTGTSSGASLLQICSTVMSEGGYIETGIDWSVVSGATRQTATQGGTRLPVLCLRLKNDFKGYPNRVIVKLTDISAYIETKPVYLELIKIPNASYLLNAGGTSSLTWTSVNTNSAVEYTITAASLTGSTDYLEVLNSSAIAAGATPIATALANFTAVSGARRNLITQNYDSTNSEIYVLSIKTIDPTNNVRADGAVTAQWREVY